MDPPVIHYVIEIFDQKLDKIEKQLELEDYEVSFNDMDKAMKRPKLFRLLLKYTDMKDYPFDHIIFKAVILKKIKIIKILLDNDPNLSPEMTGFVGIPLSWYIERSTPTVQKLFRNR